MANRKNVFTLLLVSVVSISQGAEIRRDKASDPNLLNLQAGSLSSGNKPAMFITLENADSIITSDTFASDILQRNIYSSSQSELICDLDDDSGKTCR